MRFLKDNKYFFFVLAFLPFSLAYLDGPVTAWVREFHRQQTLVVSVLSLFGKAVAVALEPAIVICSLLVLAWGWHYKRRSSFELGRALLISYICSGIMVQALKHLIGRARPRLTDVVLFIGPTLKGGYDSFPSGHTTVAFCFAYALSQYLPRYRFISYALAAAAGMARIESTSHFISDVVAGAAVGVITGKLIFAYLLPRLSARGAAAAAP